MQGSPFRGYLFWYGIQRDIAMTPTSAENAIDPHQIPRHVGIIMDGNGRWASKRGLPHAAGHEAGAKSVRAVVEAARELGIQALSLYAFSTENWRRSSTEVNALFRLLSKYIKLELENIHKEDIRVTIMGRTDGLSKKTLSELEYCKSRTAGNKSMILNVGINYGGRAEIVDAVKSIAAEVKAGRLAPEAINEDVVSKHLYHPELPDLDLLIRTSGEQRISNFMLWQISYAEIICVDTLWPDFRKAHLVKTIEEYQSRSRRFGGR